MYKFYIQSTCALQAAMEHIVLNLILLSIFSREVHSLAWFSHCFSTHIDRGLIELQCMTHERNTCPNGSSEHIKKGTSSAVALVKYRCDEPMNTLEFETNHLNQFENLQAVSVSSLGLTSVRFRAEPNEEIKNNADKLSITILHASHNQFYEIPLVFQFMSNLEHIDLSFNQIKSLYAERFRGAERLSTLNCSHNEISAFGLDVFATLFNMEILDLSHNQIQSVDNGLFVKNEKLKFLNLKGNLIKCFDFNIFSSATQFVKVFLDVSDIDAVDISCKDGICHFKDFEADAVFEHVSFFNASGNRFENSDHLHSILSKLGEQVEVLDLSRNFIGELTFEILRNFTELLHLNISHTEIQKVDLNAFFNQKYLSSLDFSYNELTVVNFIIPKSLELLNLEGNKLTTLSPWVIPKYLGNLKTIAINHNQFGCNEAEIIASQWRNLTFINQSRYKVNVNGIECQNGSLSELYVVIGLVFTITIVIVVLWNYRLRVIPFMKTRSI